MKCAVSIIPIKQGKCSQETLLNTVIQVSMLALFIIIYNKLYGVSIPCHKGFSALIPSEKKNASRVVCVLECRGSE